MLYVFENGFAIGYVDGDRFERFITPIPAAMLSE
jgi:hypothetical protein